MKLTMPKYTLIKPNTNISDSATLNPIIDDFFATYDFFFKCKENCEIYYADTQKKNNYKTLYKFFTYTLAWNINKHFFKKMNFSILFATYYSLYSLNTKKWQIHRIITGNKLLRNLMNYTENKNTPEEEDYFPINFYTIYAKKKNNNLLIIKKYTAQVNSEIENYLRSNKKITSINNNTRRK